LRQLTRSFDDPNGTGLPQLFDVPWRDVLTTGEADHFHTGLMGLKTYFNEKWIIASSRSKYKW